MTLPPPFCVGDHGPWPYPESCLLSFQGASPADSSSCGWRVSLLLSARTYGGLAQGPAWAARCALTHHVPEAAQLDSSLSCWGRCLWGAGASFVWPCGRVRGAPCWRGLPGPEDWVRQGDSESLSPTSLLSGLPAAPSAGDTDECLSSEASRG